MNEDYFIEDLRSSSEDEGDGHNGFWIQHPPARSDSPPAILAFSITSGRAKHGQQSPEPRPSNTVDTESDGEGQGDSSDGSVEEWMILDQVSEEGDSNIQLNLSYSYSSSEEDTDRKDDVDDDDDNSLLQDSWAVSKRDKESEKVSIGRYFVPGQLLICRVCTKTGHTAKSCQVQRKCPVCVLCGIQGHLQRECPTRPCSRCGLLAHGARACDRPPVWHQHCQRCGIMGHLSDICPDNWRQFHQTTKMTEVPIWRQTRQTIRRKKRRAHCYNCSNRGHFGYECNMKRMVSGTFFTLPYVCFYDSTEKIQKDFSTHNKITGNTIETPSDKQPECFKCGEHKEQLFQRNNKMKQKALASVMKTWPERRRERQQVKRLRREAQARRESGAFGQWFDKADVDISHLDPFMDSNPKKNKNPLKKINKIGVCNRRSKMPRDRKCWEKTGERKPSLLHHHPTDMDIRTENILSPKQRVRHRRR